MQTAETGYDLILDPAAYQGIHLIESDGIPIETPWHWYCMGLLNEVVIYFCRDRTDFYTGGNMFLYFNPNQAPNLDYRGPDFFYVKDGVQYKSDRLYWAVWEENGRRPDVIVELLSPTTEREDRTTKFRIYEQTLQTPEYFLYDRITDRLEGWRLIGTSYVPLQANDRGWLWSAELGLWLGTWVGHYKTMTTTWLRMYTATGELVPIHEEAERQEKLRERQRADEEKLQAVEEKRRADAEKRRADKEKLQAVEEKRRADAEKRRADKEKLQAVEEKLRADAEKRRADAEKHRADKAEEELTRLRALLQQQPPPKTNGTQPS